MKVVSVVIRNRQKYVALPVPSVAVWGKDFKKVPSVGYCASQGVYYYGYKLHALYGLSGVIHSFDLTKASVHDIHYLKNVKMDYSNCTVIGGIGHTSIQVQLNLFETANTD